MKGIKSVQLGDIKIEYIVDGSGEDLLFLHGGCGSFRAYKRMIPDLSSQYRVWAVSLPGAGKSTKLSRNWNFIDYSKVIYKFVKKVGIKPVIAGHSFGGAVSIITKANYPNNFRNLILISSAGIKHKRPNKTVFRVIVYPFIILVPSIFDEQKRLLLQDVYINLRYHSFDMIKIARMFKKLDLREDLKKIDDKTLLIWGREDRSVPVYYLDKFKKYLSNKKVYILEGDHGFLYNKGTRIAKILKEECK